jgi:predicted amidohydrolase YtcJ
MPETIRIPWLHDRHNHATLYASLDGCPSLAGKEPGDALEALRALPRDRLSLVHGWNSGRVPLASQDLRSLPPALIVNVSMHGFVLTEAGRGFLEAERPDLVAHRLDPDWCERNMATLLGAFSRIARLTMEKLEAFMSRMEALGVGALDDMLVPDEDGVRLLRESRCASRVPCWVAPETYRALSPTLRQEVAGLKFFADGALGTRTAALHGGYLDGAHGLLVHSDDELLRMLGDAHRTGHAVAIHAIGDLAIEQALQVLERLGRDGVSFPLVRLEHVQMIGERQARRARDLGAVLSMQPNFSMDSHDYADRLGRHWLEANNPFRMLIDKVGFVPGVDLVLGSDGMPHGVESAIQWSLFPPCPGQTLTVDELIAGYGADAGGGSSSLAVDHERRSVRLLESRAAR